MVSDPEMIAQTVRTVGDKHIHLMGLVSSIVGIGSSQMLAFALFDGPVFHFQLLFVDVIELQVIGD